MKRRKRKKTLEERAAERAYRDDLTRRLQAAIERLRTRAEEKRPPHGEPPLDRQTSEPLQRKSWTEMSREERAAERARSRDLDRRLLAAIERYRTMSAQKRRRSEPDVP